MEGIKSNNWLSNPNPCTKISLMLSRMSTNWIHYLQKGTLLTTSRLLLNEGRTTNLEALLFWLKPLHYQGVLLRKDKGLFMYLRCFFLQKLILHKLHLKSESELEIVLHEFDWGSRQLTYKKQHMFQGFLRVPKLKLWYVWLCCGEILCGRELSSLVRAWIWFFHHSKYRF